MGRGVPSSLFPKSGLPIPSPSFSYPCRRPCPCPFSYPSPAAGRGLRYAGAGSPAGCRGHRRTGVDPSSCRNPCPSSCPSCRDRPGPPSPRAAPPNLPPPPFIPSLPAMVMMIVIIMVVVIHMTPSPIVSPRTVIIVNPPPPSRVILRVALHHHLALHIAAAAMGPLIVRIVFIINTHNHRWRRGQAGELWGKSWQVSRGEAWLYSIVSSFPARPPLLGNRAAYSAIDTSALSRSSIVSRREIISTLPSSSSQSCGARPIEL